VIIVPSGFSWVW